MILCTFSESIAVRLRPEVGAQCFRYIQSVYEQRVADGSVLRLAQDEEFRKQAPRSPDDRGELYQLVIRIPVSESQKYDAIHLIAEKTREYGQEYMKALRCALHPRKPGQ